MNSISASIQKVDDYKTVKIYIVDEVNIPVW